jgi:hypothetical protein
LGQNGVPSLSIIILIAWEISLIDIGISDVRVIVFPESDSCDAQRAEKAEPDLEVLHSGSVESVLQKLS